MNVLFVHQNFPGQFKHIAPVMAASDGNVVVAMTMQSNGIQGWQGVNLVPYGASRGTTPTIHPWVSDFETKVIRGEACFRAALQLKAQGFNPDVIIAHPGWGESLFLKEVWPKVKLGIYCEFFYRAYGLDVGFDAEFLEQDIGNVCRINLKNVTSIMHFQTADAAICPTRWQASTFPDYFRDKITVVHDGIDTDVVAPNPLVSVTLNGSIVLSRENEVVTFVSRNLEPYRGYHVFMRALPEILARRPKANILIVGGDELSYGFPAPEGQSWKDKLIDEVRPLISDSDWARVYFLGRIPYHIFIAVLQLSTVHAYLTYPFVLSWSLLEAMSVGCAIVASDTQPVHEAIIHDETGRLVDFFDINGLADTVCTLLDDPSARKRLGANAREFARQHYDLKTVCLPKQLKWLEKLASK